MAERVPASDVDSILGAIKRAFDRAKSEKLMDRVELKRRAEQLGAAAHAWANALLYLDDEELIFYLAHASALMKRLDLGCPTAVKEAHAFYQATRDLRTFRDRIVAETRLLADRCDEAIGAGKYVGKQGALAREGKSRDSRRQLGLTLALYWRMLTGEAPTFSGKAALENPATAFGRFVALAAKTHGAERLFEKGFAGFLERAVKDAMKA